MHATPPCALLEARELTVVLPGDAGPVRVLDGVSLTLTCGEVVDVTGPSGAGKTTLLRALARLMPQGSGALFLGGVSASEMGPQRWRSRVALLPQKPVIVAGDIAENLTLPWRLKARDASSLPDANRLRSALDEIGLADVALERDAARLSLGQQARVALTRVLLTRPALTRVLLTRPDVLLLDEPDAALDKASSAALAATLRAFAEDGGGIVRSRHRDDDGLAMRRLALAAGRLTEEARP